MTKVKRLGTEEASKLINSLGEHPALFPIEENRYNFISALTSTLAPTSSEFYVPLKFDPEQREIHPKDHPEQGQYHYFFVRGVINNELAALHLKTKRKIPKPREKLIIPPLRWAMFFLSIASYSSKSAIKKAISNPDLIRIFAQSHDKGNLYSLLGKVETYDLDKEGAQCSLERPILAVPGITREDIGTILQFEEENILPAKRMGLFFKEEMELVDYEKKFGLPSFSREN